ncbi:MAG: aldo/keto reductase [Mycoplasma sp.]|nr:aldo/keto reductase [Mycoplasma sp.]
MKKIGIGTYRVKNQEEMDVLIKNAIKNKYDYIDTAWYYKNEDMIAKSLEKYDLNNEANIQTKIWPEHFDNVKEQFLDQLKTLKKNKIWSILLHRPHFDFRKTLSAWKELIKLKEEGYVEVIGVSNFDKTLLNALEKETNVMPEINQIELSLENFREDRYLFAKQNNIKIQAWSPIRMDFDNMIQKNKDILNKISKNHNCSVVEIALAFLFEQGIEPIVKSVNENRIKINYDAQNIKLDVSEIKELKKINSFNNKASETFVF